MSWCPGFSVLVLMCNSLVPVFTVRHTWKANDVISFEELKEGSVELFTGFKEHTDHFKLLFQEKNSILVGARNIVYNISLNNLTEDSNRRLTWHPKKSDQSLCQSKFGENTKDEKYQSKCQNFIQVLGKMDDGKLYVCGTNAFKPLCRIYVYKEANYPIQIPEYESIQEEPGQGRASYDPEHNSTAIYSDGKLYSATSVDFNAQDPLILMSDLRDGKKLRTAQHDSLMLNDPNFVSSFDIDDKIYFFLRENAVENINCGKSTFSRVARICKKDQGGQIEEGVWTSFFKARLNCSFPGDIPFPFDELQSTSNFAQGNVMPTKSSTNRTKMFYGVFNTPDNSIQGSAVCAFTYSDIEDAFQGKFKGQQTVMHNWLSVGLDKTPTPHPATVCRNDTKSISDVTLNFIHSHPLMDTAVGAFGGQPVLMQTMASGRFTAIAIDWQVLAADRAYYDVMFVGTSDGRILKAINVGLEGKIESTVIEDIQVLGKDEPVKELKIVHPAEKLIIISKDNIKSIPLHRCSRHKTCGDCVALQDPYCAWHENECSAKTSRGLESIRTGDTSKCPDGGRREGSTQSTVETTTSTPAPVTCPVCSCNCSQTYVVDVTINAANKSKDGPLRPLPNPEDTGVDNAAQSRAEPCENKIITVRTDDQVYTASTLAIASVVSIVVAALVGFVIGYRVSLCRNHTRNTEQVINFEQQFGSLRKNPNRHSINETTHNFYADPNIQKQFNKNNIQNVLVSNNIPQKSPNLPNGTIESKTVTPKQAKTYL